MTVIVAAFTGSKNVASRRFRLLQYIDKLAVLGIEIKEHYSYFGSWPPSNKLFRPFWLGLTLIDRFIPVIRSRNANMVFFQREMVSTLLTFELFTKGPRILDVDDAIWLQGPRAFRSIEKLVRKCDAVVCGNQFIYDHLSSWNSNCFVVPTSVDTDRFVSNICSTISTSKVIGWSGQSSGFKFLYEIESELIEVLNIHEDAVIRIVSNERPKFLKIPIERIEYVKWSPDNEVETIQTMSVGIMPIDLSEWSKGKCSYKMLLYMACSIPVVVSDYGMNSEVLSKGDIGFGVRTSDEWITRISLLLDNEDLAYRMGQNGCKVVHEFYSLESNVLLLAEVFKSLIRN